MQARCKADKDYANYMTAQTLVQTCGRGVRSDTDVCENFILDDNFGWFWWYNKHLFPQWFMDSIRKMNALPKPIELE